jgi:serine/threonine protein kinase
MLLNAPHVALTPTQKQILIVGILIGMVYLRENRIRHRDVRPANVLVDEVGDSHYLLLHSFMR